MPGAALMPKNRKAKDEALERQLSRMSFIDKLELCGQLMKLSHGLRPVSKRRAATLSLQMNGADPAKPTNHAP